MPYVMQSIRDYYDPTLNRLIEKLDNCATPPGDLNYCITRLLIAAFVKNPSYGTVNMLEGVLVCAGKEFYARLGREYEKIAIERNGDVYP